MSYCTKCGQGDDKLGKELYQEMESEVDDLRAEVTRLRSELEDMAQTKRTGRGKPQSELGPGEFYATNYSNQGD